MCGELTVAMMDSVWLVAAGLRLVYYTLWRGRLKMRHQPRGSPSLFVGANTMRFSLRTLLILLTLAAVDFAA
jgi:hypothetical protein